MSGITALFDRGGGPDPSLVEAMHETISHRGPDGGDTWRAEGVGLGHQLLAATPEAAHEAQPRAVTTDAGHRLAVTADVRLDNRQELLSACDLPGDVTHESGDPVTDPELLLAAYDRWGADCVEHLLGAFAFAVWDEERERLFCARDHVGVKPFYYHRREDCLALASELKGVLALSSVPVDQNDTAVGDFLTGLFEDRAITVYEAARRLPPAHAMTVDADDWRTWRYWDLDPTETISLPSDEAYERRFRELFEQAVADRLRTTETVATSLSGGTDSSSITVVARDLLPDDEPLYAFSNVFEEATSSDEREYIEAVVDRPGIRSECVVSDDVPALVDADTVFSQFDRPPHNTTHGVRWERTKRTAEAGVGVVMEGAMGDSAIGYGLGLLPELARTGRLWRLYDEASAMGEVYGAAPRQVIARHAVAPLVPERAKRWYRRRRGEPVLEAEANPTLDPAFVERVGLRARHRDLQNVGSVLRRSARRWQYRSLRSGETTASLETSDLTHAAFGIEPRYPFTDVRLLEFSLAMPPGQQLKDGWTRSIVRRALADLLPEEVQWRPWKTGQNEAFHRSLSFEADRLARLVEESGPLDRYLDADGFRAAVDRFGDEPSARDARALWRALSLSAWLEHRERIRRRPASA